MNFTLLQSFLEQSYNSANPKIKRAAETLTDQMVAAKETEEIEQPTLHSEERNQPLNNRPKDEIDKHLSTWMPDIVKPDPEVSEFGKAASMFDLYSKKLNTKPTLFQRYGLHNNGR
jgi:hypothetical protein